MENSLWYLENIDVTNIFCPNKVGDLTREHTEKSFKKGDYIYLPDQSADKLFFITEGSVKIGSFSDAGKEITKSILSKGEVFGEMSMIGETKRRDFAFAVDDCKLCIVSANEMKSMMKEHNPLSLFFMKVMGSRILEMEHRLESLVFKDSKTRIIEFLVDLVEKKGQRVGYEWMVRSAITHQEIANLTATSRQTVTTILNELRTSDILTFNRKRILVRNLEELKKLTVVPV